MSQPFFGPTQLHLNLLHLKTTHILEFDSREVNPKRGCSFVEGSAYDVYTAERSNTRSLTSVLSGRYGYLLLMLKAIGNYAKILCNLAARSSRSNGFSRNSTPSLRTK